MIVDADHLAPGVEKRTARIAVIDRRIRLDEFVIRPAEIAMCSADDAGGDGSLQAEWITDRKHPIANANFVTVADRDCRESPTGINFQKRNIEIQALAEQTSLLRRAVLQRHVNFIGVLDDVPVGNNDPACVDDRAGTDDVDDVRRVGDAFATLTRLRPYLGSGPCP